MRIGLTGATGFIGGVFGKLAAAHGHAVVAYSRSPKNVTLPWVNEVRPFDPNANLPLDANGIDVMVHLAGESIMGLWTAAKKKRIRDSRVEVTQRIARALATASPRPAAFLCASGSGFYGNRGDDKLDESSPAGSDFLAQVCVEWEAAARRAEQLDIRVVLLRTGLVLGNEGGLWPVTRMAFNNYAGGRFGSGKHWMPWIHVQDEARLILWAAERSDIAGQINLTAPNPVTNAAFTAAVAKALEKPAFMHVPAFALKLLLRGMGEMILGSQRVSPNMALVHGFQFDHPTLEGALASLTSK